MFLKQKIFAVLVSFFIFAGIIYLIKKGKLKEEYSWLWFLTGLVLLTLVLWYDLLLFLSYLIGAVAPTTTLFLFGIIFLLLFLLHFAVKMSQLTGHVKNLAQEVSLLDAENNLLKRGAI
jgi:hypothetical protein